MRFLSLIVAAIALIVLGTIAAFAQVPGVPEVDISNLFGLVLLAASVVLSTLGAWAIKWLVYKLKLDADSRVREYLTQALEAGVNFGISKVAGAAGKMEKVTIRSEVAAAALAYANRSVPAAIQHFGLTQERLKELIEARLPNPPASGAAS